MLVERGGDVVELAAGVPGRPGDAARGIHHLRVGTLPDQPQVVGDGVPEPGGIGVGAREQIGIAGDAVPLHEAAQPAALEVLLAGPPGDWLVQALPVLRVAGYGGLAHCYTPPSRTSLYELGQRLLNDGTCTKLGQDLIDRKSRAAIATRAFQSNIDRCNAGYSAQAISKLR